MRTVGQIAIVLNDLQPYGSQRVAITLAEALTRQQISVDLITLEPQGRDGLEVPAAVRRIALQRPCKGAAGYAAIVGRLRAVLAEPRQLVIAHMTLANVVTLSALATLPPRRRPPALVTEHNLISARATAGESRALVALARGLYQRARGVVGVSEAVVHDLQLHLHVDLSKSVCIMNPVDVESVRQQARVAPPHEWLVPGENVRTVVCVGGFRQAKGQDILIRALSRTRGARVVFVGDGELLEDARLLASSLELDDRVAFVGYRNDAPAFIANARALVVPSRWEGFGLVAVESAALGVPVVGTSVAGLSELIPTYVPGVLVPPEDPDALAGAIDEVLAGGQIPGEASLGRFSPDAVAKAYLAAGGLD